MITLELLQRIWSLLKRPTSFQGQVEARELEQVNTPYGNPLVTIDVHNHRHLLLPVPTDISLEQDVGSSGIHVISNQWGDAHHLQRYVDVVCLKPHLNDLFDMVLIDILQVCSEDLSRPDKACIAVLDRWRELLKSEKGQLPDKSVLIGIWGELQHLLKMTAYNREAINAWTGPFGGRRDFDAGSVAIEIKTSTQRKGMTVTIHGHDQLEVSENETLYLSLIQVEELPTSGENINDLVNQIVALGCSRIRLMKALNNLGLSVDLLAESNDLRLRLRDWRMYLVDEQFPKITSQSFGQNRIPDGIQDIVYKIDLSTHPPHPLSADALEAVIKQFVDEVK